MSDQDLFILVNPALSRIDQWRVLRQATQRVSCWDVDNFVTITHMAGGRAIRIPKVVELCARYGPLKLHATGTDLCAGGPGTVVINDADVDWFDPTNCVLPVIAMFGFIGSDSSGLYQVGVDVNTTSGGGTEVYRIIGGDRPVTIQNAGGPVAMWRQPTPFYGVVYLINMLRQAQYAVLVSQDPTTKFVTYTPNGAHFPVNDRRSPSM